MEEPAGSQVPDRQQARERDLEFVERFLDNQEREIEIRRRELEIEAENNERHYQLGLRTIDAQVQDRQDERGYRTTRSMQNKVFAGAVLLIAVAFLSVLFWLDKDQAALEIVRVIAYGGAGGIGGYGWARHKRNVSGEHAQEPDNG